MTPLLPLDAFAPWIAQLPWNYQKWFAKVFKQILDNDFSLESGQLALQKGHALSFFKSDLHIDAFRSHPTNEYANRPLIILMNEALHRELTITVNTPIEVVRLAIETLANEE